MESERTYVDQILRCFCPPHTKKQESLLIFNILVSINGQTPIKCSAKSDRQQMNSRHFPFWLITGSLFIGLIVPILIQDGMFMDGVLYTCVAKNLANGIGSFWFPKFSELGFAGSATFHEHPPLVFGIQALFFKIFGNSIYVERFYSFLTAAITAYLITRLWKLLTNDEQELQRLRWLPVLFWMVIPVGFWSYQNNVLENTMGIATLMAVYFSLKGLYSIQRAIPYLLLSGVFIFLASFAKGVPGLFPIGVVGLYWLISRDLPFSKMLVYTIILILTPAVIYSLILINTEAFESLSIYLNERLLGRIGSAPTVDTRFYIGHRLFMELLPVLVITLIMLVVYKLKSIKQKFKKTYNHKIKLIVLIGCSGSLPLMLTLVQKGFYMAHSLPFFAIGFALIISPGLIDLINKIKTERKSFKAFKMITLLIFVSTIVFSVSRIGKVGRNGDLLHDVYLMGKIIPPHSVINIDKSMWNEWDLQCYLIRHFNISIDPSDKQHNFYLIRKTLDNIPDERYKKLGLNTKRYNVYQANFDNQ